MTQELREQAAEQALGWVSTPYHPSGLVKGPGGGVDCAMLLVGVYKAMGFVPQDFDPRPYPRDWNLHMLEEVMLEFVTRFAVPTNDPSKGDVVLYKFGRCYAHAAIILEWPERVVHAVLREKMVLVSHGRDGQFATEKTAQGVRERPVLFFTFNQYKVAP